MPRPQAMGTIEPNAQNLYEVTRADLPLHCPMPGMSLWNSHPKVFLPIEESGRAKCPYCSADYVLKSGDRLASTRASVTETYTETGLSAAVYSVPQPICAPGAAIGSLVCCPPAREGLEIFVRRSGAALDG